MENENKLILEVLVFAIFILGFAYTLLSIAIKIVLSKKGYPISYIRTSITEVFRFRKFIHEQQYYKHIYYASIIVLLLTLVLLVMVVIFAISAYKGH